MRMHQLVTGIFIQDDPAYVPALEQIEPRFGLLGDAWPDAAALNAQAPEGTSYKLVIAGRHGQGFHNVAETKYGTKAWDDYWAFQYGDDEITWAPDPELTDIGLEQARTAHSAWEKYAPPTPEIFLSSPLRRALKTCQITFPGQSALVGEIYREHLTGHTCDFRLSVSTLRKDYSDFDWSAMKDDEDPFTKETENTEQVAQRARRALDEIFANEPAQVVSITAHSGWIQGLNDALGRKRYSLPTGGVAPFLIKAVKAA
ncbi:phosphoglycerate mutase-like protein [Auricularia subglabra TFB-10046 SS5]|nr:phosphoglycerate mutase-like protein [Auricularia subglabra TFB-10046 SS5]